MMDDLVAFLRARIREDWDAADLVLRPYGDLASHNDGEWWKDEKVWTRYHDLSTDETPLITRMHPERVIAACKVKEAMIELYLMSPDPEQYGPGSYGRLNDMRFGQKVAFETVLRTMSLEYMDHPDYNHDWNYNYV